MNAIKLTFISIGALLALSACDKDEMSIDERNKNDRRIVFRASLPEVTSRAQTITKDNLSYFYVTAFDPDDGDLIQNNILKEYIKNKELRIDAGQFVSESCIWPKPGQESDQLHFFAYYPELPSLDDFEKDPTFEGDFEKGPTLDNRSTVSGGKAYLDYRISKYSIAPDISDQVDFVTAYATGSMVDNLFSGIKLNFAHQLCCIEIKAKGSNESCDIEIAGVRIGGVGVEDTFIFNEEGGQWSDDLLNKGKVEYVFCNGDKVVKVDSHDISIMGKANCAMLIPASYDKWDPKKDGKNEYQGMYISVLLRVIDKTPGANGELQYPDEDNNQGQNALNQSVVYFAVDSENNIKTRLYKNDGKYFTELGSDQEYDIEANEAELKKFGWAALPVSSVEGQYGEAQAWVPGYIYTYILNYTSGVGLHDPEDELKPGEQIISDRVTVEVKMEEWVRDPENENEMFVPYK